MISQDELVVATQGRGTYDLSARVQDVVAASGIKMGMCHVFIRHTSASLMLCENADPSVRLDLEPFMSEQVPDGAPMFQHSVMVPARPPAHVRSILTQSDLNLPVSAGQCALGTWQGIYLWEHRHAPHTRHVVVTVQGE